jgi:hypothetical protein
MPDWVQPNNYIEWLTEVNLKVESTVGNIEVLINNTGVDSIGPVRL